MGKDAASPPSAAPEEASSSDRGGEFVRRPLGSLESEGENLAAQTEESVEALASSLVLQDSRAASPHKTAAASQRVFTPTGSSPSLRGGAAGSGSSLKKHTHSPPPASLSALSALGGGGGSAGGVSFASVVERHQQSLGHAHPSSSRAATEGSPPSSPRSTFSSIISFQDAAFSAALNASGRGGNLELLSADAEEDGSLIAGCGADARAPLGGCLRNAVVSNVLSDSIVATACGADSLPADGEYQVSVSVPDLKFSCSHFVAYKGFRERMHGHNYTVAVAVGGELGGDGFVLDFSDLKKVVRAVCKSIDHHVIIPMKSDVIEITHSGPSIRMLCEDGSEFVLPRVDCICLPIVHATAEELSVFIWRCIAQGLTAEFIKRRGLKWLEVSVSECEAQTARFRAVF